MDSRRFISKNQDGLALVMTSLVMAGLSLGMVLYYTSGFEAPTRSLIQKLNTSVSKQTFYDVATVVAPYVDTVSCPTNGNWSSASSKSLNGATYSYACKMTLDQGVPKGLLAVSSASQPSADKGALLLTLGAPSYAVYPLNGPNWNDYVTVAQNPVAGHSNYKLWQADTACVPGTSSTPCVHAGELRKFRLVGFASCAGVVISDALGAFDWTCDMLNGSPHALSTGLKKGKGLSDLIKPDGSGWKPNHINVTNGVTSLTGPDAIWWNNPIKPLPSNGSGAPATLANASANVGTIYVLTASQTSNGYLLSQNKTGLVVLSGQTLTYGDSSSSNCSIFASNQYCVVFLSNSSFNWVEGTLNGLGSNRNATIGVYGSYMNYSQFRNLNISNIKALGAGGMTGIAAGISFGNNNIVRGLVALGTGTSLSTDTGGGLNLNTSSYNDLRDIYVSRVYGNNIYMMASSHNTLVGFSVTGSNFDGVSIWNSSYNTVANGIAVNNAVAGIDIYMSYAHVISNVIVANTHFGIQLAWGDALGGTMEARHVVSHITTMNNQEGMFPAFMLDKNNLVNNWLSYGDQIGLQTNGSTGASTFSNVAYTDGKTAVRVAQGAADPANTFSQNLIFGPASIGQCNVSVVGKGVEVAGTGTGSGNCQLDAASNATIATNGSLTPYIGGAVTTTDPSNASNVNGANPYGAITDWLNFNNSYRFWGAAPGTSGPCVSGQSCQIWDARLSSNAADWALNAFSAATNGSPCPASVDGSVTLTSPDGSRTFLTHAIELDDPTNINNNGDGLCEAGETCLYAPNYGAYQGDNIGPVDTCIFNDGPVVKGVNMRFYRNNGF